MIPESGRCRLNRTAAPVEPAGTEEPGDRPDPRETVDRALKSARRNHFPTGLAVGVVVTVAIVLLIIRNGKSARLNWLAFHFSPPLWIMLLLTAAAGAVVWEVIKAGRRHARRRRRDRREAVKAAQEMTRR
jgi:uncharacterized integral membrane protein